MIDNETQEIIETPVEQEQTIEQLSSVSLVKQKQTVILHSIGKAIQILKL